MKKILCGTVAAIALVGIAAPAAAQTNERHYAGIVPVLNIPYTATNPSTTDLPNPLFPFIGGPTIPGTSETAGHEALLTLGIGTRYTATADAPADSETASPIVDVEFVLSGTVNKDCSFYAGNNTNATNIDFGVIGIKTGDNENVNSAFEMVGPAEAEVETLTAGCNTNNQVEISKDDIRGLVNSAPGGYDSNEFQAHIPYSVTAAWIGVGPNTIGAGSDQDLTVGVNANAAQKQQGAWRSNLTIDFVAPAVTSHGLVAGNYEGTTTLTLRAL